MVIHVKKIKAVMVFVIVCFMLMGATISARAETIQPALEIDGKRVILQKELGKPFVDKNNRTLVPLRGALEAFGAEVNWDQDSQEAIIKNGEVTVTVPLGASFIFKNGEKIKNDTESVALDNRIYLPIRIVLEAFGAKVDYDYSRNVVMIYKNTEPPISSTPQNKEMKAVWISYLDYPNFDYNEDKFKSTIDAKFDMLKKKKINTVIFQVRPYADALYPSKYFPWSKFLLNRQGENPGYDPMKYMIESAHNRGLEFHAWVNPYRITGYRNGNKDLAKGNPFSGWENKRWVLNHGGFKYFNPSVPQVRELIINGVKEIVEGYDVDGIHFDDYFYPSLKGAEFDLPEYKGQGKNISLTAWRRDNVNKLVTGCYSAVKEIKPNVVFGISPAGNIDNLKSSSAYFVDIDKWMSNPGYVDYIMPQLYWGFEARKRNGSIAPYAYENNLKRWIALKKKGNVKLYVGLNLAAAGKNVKDGNKVSEWLRYNDILARQVRYARKTGDVSGFALFREGLFTPYNMGKEYDNLIREI